MFEAAPAANRSGAVGTWLDVATEAHAARGDGERGLQRVSARRPDGQLRGSGTEHETGDEIGALPREQLRDRAAHRVAGEHHRPGVQRVEQRGEVVGAVVEPEHGAGAHPATVAAEVGGEHPELAAEGLEHPAPVEAAAAHPAVEEDEGGRAGRPGQLAHEGGAAAGELDGAALGHGRRHAVLHELADERADRAPDGAPDRARSQVHPTSPWSMVPWRHPWRRDIVAHTRPPGRATGHRRPRADLALNGGRIRAWPSS